eukprot:TRINITY_DN1258_c1_g1_i1.p1 TRINITY_DN1258_c1_g1~~TRINITY_DN1258_c1_g1_i1.p1  ORF type:complete len:566 (-),score=96.44 TRINITY_DN1258_c1_g1_i1:94-1791(-)
MKLKLLSLVALLLLAITSCSAYDTGFHTDLLRNSMGLMGFNNYSIDVTALTNWMTDYFSYTLFSPITELHALHFDNINSLKNVSNYYNTLTINSRSAIQDAVRRNDILRFLGLIGLTTHAIQDFYTHSTWVDLHQSSCGCYRDDTWFSALAAVNGSVRNLQGYLQGLSTYSSHSGDGTGCDPFEPNCFPGRIFHGDYCGGINKDSYIRPKWEASYSFAFAATVEWVYNVLVWADDAAGIAYNPLATTLPGSTNSFITRVKNYTPSSSDLSDLQSDVVSSIVISYAATTPSGWGSALTDGHYKGAGTGSAARLAAYTLAFERRGSIYHDLMSENRIYAPLVSPNPYWDIIGDENFPQAYTFYVPYIDIPASLRNFTKVKVRTTSVVVNDRLSTPSPYARIHIDGQEFIEAVQSRTTDFKPHWTSVKFIPASTTNITILYTLFNDRFPISDSQYQLTDSSYTAVMTMDVYSHQLYFMNVNGAVNGVYDHINNTVALRHDGTEIMFYATQHQQGNCVLDINAEWGNMFCPDEAYTEYLLHPICGSALTNAGSTSIHDGLMFWILSLFE